MKLTWKITITTTYRSKPVNVEETTEEDTYHEINKWIERQIVLRLFVRGVRAVQIAAVWRQGGNVAQIVKSESKY